MLNERRIKTMRERLGNASSLVDNDQYLPRARRVQMDTTADEFAKIIELANKADNPQHYFLSIISKKNIDRTLKYVRRILSGAVKAVKRAVNAFKSSYNRNYNAHYTGEIKQERRAYDGRPEILDRKQNDDGAWSEDFIAQIHARALGARA